MMVQIDVDDPPNPRNNCSDCGAHLPFRMVRFDHAWYVGQICRHCRRAQLTYGVYATPEAAQYALAHFAISRIRDTYRHRRPTPLALE